MPSSRRPEDPSRSTTIVGVRFTEGERKTLNRLAKHYRITPSQVIRQLVKAEHGRVFCALGKEAAA